MYKDGESVFYYLTVMNENYEMLPMPEGSREGILKGLYKLRPSSKKKAKGRAQLKRGTADWTRYAEAVFLVLRASV